MMTTIRLFTCEDAIRLNNATLDPIAEVYSLQFLMNYMLKWPDCFLVAESPSGEIMGYVMGAVQGDGTNRYGLVAAIAVAPCFRRLGVAKILLNELEDISIRKGAFYMELHVRVSNTSAINLYQTLGYGIFRINSNYYVTNPKEDAYEMRKTLTNGHEQSMVPTSQPNG